MKKILILSLLMSAGLCQGFSQIKFGIRGGVNWNYVKADDILVENNTQLLTIPTGANLGYHFGIISQIKLFNLFIQPELLFLSNKNDVVIKDAATQKINEGFAEQRVFHLDMPVMVGVKIKSFKVEAGPVGTIFLGDKSSLVEISNYEQKYKTLTFGYQAGIGLDFTKISLDFKYEGNLGKFGENLTVGDKTFNFDQRSSQLVFSIGLFF